MSGKQTPEGIKRYAEVIELSKTMTAPQIAEKVGTEPSTVRGILRKHGLKAVPVRAEKETKHRVLKDDNYDPFEADMERLSPFTGKILRDNELYHQWEGGNKPTPTPDKYNQDLTILKVNTGNILMK